MTILETISQLKQQGMTDEQIISQLREQNISPREITDALSQFQIKSEISRENEYNSQPEKLENISVQPEQESTQFQEYSPPQEYSSQPISEPQQYAQYPEYSYSQYPQSTDIETISEVASQLLDERLNKLNKELVNLIKFKEEFSQQVNIIETRLEKIENNFNNLQMAIIGRIGEFGEDIKNISREMRETQNSFSKIINPLTDRAREIQGSSSESSKKQLKKSGFENYLR